MIWLLAKTEEWINNVLIDFWTEKHTLVYIFYEDEMWFLYVIYIYIYIHIYIYIYIYMRTISSTDYNIMYKIFWDRYYFYKLVEFKQWKI